MQKVVYLGKVRETVFLCQFLDTLNTHTMWQISRVAGAASFKTDHHTGLDLFK